MILSCGLNSDGQCGTSQERTRSESHSVPSGPSPLTELLSPSSAPTPRTTDDAFFEDPHFPRPISVRSRVVSVSAGSRHSLALTADGDVFSWGWGLQGQLGLGHSNTVLRPNKVDLPSKIVHIAAGGIHSGCIDAAGSCYTWGSSEYGQLGRPIVGTIDNKPGLVLLEFSDEPLRMKKLSLGGMHSAAIDADGFLWCWGRADSGQTGSGRWVYASFPGITFPAKTPGIENVKDVSCGGFHTAVVTADGRAFSMGKSDFGVLGTGLGTPGKMESEMLTEITALSGHQVVGVSCGGWHTMLWTSEGELFACGKGEYGRMGVGNEKPIPTPKHVKMPESAKVVSVSSGGSHSIILTSSGQVFVCGRSDDYRLALLNVSEENHKVLSPVPVTIDWNLYLSPNKRTLLGANKPTDSLVVKQVAAGGAHTLILTDIAC